MEGERSGVSYLWHAQSIANEEEQVLGSVSLGHKTSKKLTHNIGQHRGSMMEQCSYSLFLAFLHFLNPCERRSSTKA